MSERPKKEFRSGCVRLSLWETERESGGERFATASFTVDKIYKDAEGKWQYTASFRTADLPHIELLVRKAFEQLTLKERDPQEPVAQ